MCKLQAVTLAHHHSPREEVEGDALAQAWEGKGSEDDAATFSNLTGVYRADVT